MPTTLHRMFLLHIQTEMVSTGNVSHKPMPSTLYRMFLLHIQAEMGGQKVEILHRDLSKERGEERN